MNIAIIPARGGSRRIPRKNVRPFHGKPVLAYSIEVAKRCGLFDKVVVSTEDEQVQAVARYYGAKIHNRARRLADDITGTQGVMQNALQWWVSGAKKEHQPSYACCIYATAPLLTVEDLQSGYSVLIEGGYDYTYIEGWYYWGRADSFLDGVPLEGPRTMRTEVPERWVDINTEQDWLRAERMYADLHGVPA